MTALSPLKKIDKIDEATHLVMTYQENIDSIVEKNLIVQTLASLEPYIEMMNSITPDMAAMDAETITQLQRSITKFRTAIDNLLNAVTQVRDHSIAETQHLKQHTKSTAAYRKANREVKN